MIFWITLALLIVTIAVHVRLLKRDAYNELDKSCLVLVVLIVILAIELGVMGFTLLGSKGREASYQEHRKLLVERYTQCIKDGKFNYMDDRILQDIDTWNSDLAWRKEVQNDLWIGIFVPDIYSDLDYITINQFMKNDWKKGA